MGFKPQLNSTCCPAGHATPWRPTRSAGFGSRRRSRRSESRGAAMQARKWFISSRKSWLRWKSAERQVLGQPSRAVIELERRLAQIDDDLPVIADDAGRSGWAGAAGNPTGGGPGPGGPSTTHSMRTLAMSSTSISETAQMTAHRHQPPGYRRRASRDNRFRGSAQGAIRPLVPRRAAYAWR